MRPFKPNVGGATSVLYCQGYDAKNFKTSGGENFQKSRFSVCCTNFSKYPFAFFVRLWGRYNFWKKWWLSLLGGSCGHQNQYYLNGFEHREYTRNTSTSQRVKWTSGAWVTTISFQWLPKPLFFKSPDLYIYFVYYLFSQSVKPNDF